MRSSQRRAALCLGPPHPGASSCTPGPAAETPEFQNVYQVFGVNSRRRTMTRRTADGKRCLTIGMHGICSSFSSPYLEVSLLRWCLVITFQRSISFSGDTDDLPSVQVTFEVPRLAFMTSDDVVTRLHATAGASATFEHSTGQNTYRVTAPGGLLADDSRDVQALAVRYFRTAFQTCDLDAFVLPVTVVYRSLDGQLLGTSEFSVLAIPAFASQTPATATSRTAVRLPTMDSVVVLDRADLLALRARVPEIVDDSVLLLAVLGCTTITDDTVSFNEAGTEQVASHLESQDMDAAVSAKLVTGIKSTHSRLVDIELEVPSLQPLKIAGTLTASAPASVTISAADFAACARGGSYD
jgi:hypothetical protein